MSPQTNLNQAIQDSGLFDAAYYLSCYREEILGDMDPLDHFLQVGLERGFKPNPTFDPLVYRIHHPELEGADLVQDYLTRHPDGSLDLSVRRALSTIKPLPAIRPRHNPATNDLFDLASAKRYGEPTVLDFVANGHAYRLLAPSADDFLQRLTDDRPFAFCRLSHGDWDCLLVHQRYRNRIARSAASRGLPGDLLDRLAARLCDELHHDQAMYAENFITELQDDLRAHCRDEAFMHGIAFKGFPTADERLISWSPVPQPSDEPLLGLLATYFDPDERLYDATVWKRWLVAGTLAPLPELARERPVILMGPERLASLGERWQLPWFLHLVIPPNHSYGMRYRLLERCRETIAEAERLAERHGTQRPLFLLQGSSLAYWFILRLHRDHRDIFYLDLGQALHAWFYDKPEIELYPWGKLYGPTIVRNCGLADYYERLGVPKPVMTNLFKGRLGP